MDELHAVTHHPETMWHRLNERMDDTILLMSISLVFCIIRTIMQPSSRRIRTYLAMFFVCVPVGTLAGQIARDHDFSDSGVCMASAVASLLAQDIVMALIKNNGLISRALEGFVTKWLNLKETK